MQADALGIEGALLLRPEPELDERGFFARLYERPGIASADAGHTDGPTSVSVAWNRQIHTLRGLHVQVSPCEERKHVTCVRGSIFDVLVDLRPTSSTYLRWVSAGLDAHNLHSLVVPPGVAHGYLTLVPETLVLYQIEGRHSSTHARGLRWDDRAIGIVWPFEPKVISHRDMSWPSLGPGPDEGLNARVVPLLSE